jgi:hypothetical protein
MEKFITIDMIEKSDLLIDAKLFTKLQIEILKKKLQNKKLDSNEKTYYYKFIKPKLSAMLEFFKLKKTIVIGKEYFYKNRLSEAQIILKKLEKQHKNKKIMISGSFLFSKNYKDIDVFIFSKYKKQDIIKNNLHITYLIESSVDSLFFNSLRMLSISNFHHAQTDIKLSVKDLLQTYELLINEILSHEDYKKNLRNFLLQSQHLNGILLNPLQLHVLSNSLNRKNIEILSNMLINSLCISGSNSKILKDQLSNYKKLQKEYKNAKNIPIYIKTYGEAIRLLSK